MNENSFAFGCLLLAVLASPVLAQPLTVSRISVTGTETSDPELVRDAFLEVAVGDSLDEAALAEAASLARDRLVATGYFSSVDVLVIRSKNKPNTAAVVAEVTDGFPGRYGGGPIWARLGTANLGGKGQDFDLFLGWNRQSVSWGDRLVASRGWSLLAEAGNRPLVWTGLDGSRQEDHGLGGSASLTKDWGWGWSSAAALSADAVFNPDYTSPQLSAWPRARLEWNRTSPGFSPERGASLRLEASTRVPGDKFRFSLDARSYLPLGAGFKLALRTSSVFQNLATGPHEDLVLSGLDGVRKVYDSTDRGLALAWASSELRWAQSWDLGFTNLTLEPALVVDAGQAWDPQPTGLVWAAGGALRPFVGAPISLPLRLELTSDNQNRLRLGFGASAPY